MDTGANQVHQHRAAARLHQHQQSSQGRARVPLLALARHRLVLSLLELTRHLPGPILRQPEPMPRLQVLDPQLRVWAPGQHSRRRQALVGYLEPILARSLGLPVTLTPSQEWGWVMQDIGANSAGSSGTAGAGIAPDQASPASPDTIAPIGSQASPTDTAGFSPADNQLTADTTSKSSAPGDSAGSTVDAAAPADCSDCASPSAAPAGSMGGIYEGVPAGGPTEPLQLIDDGDTGGNSPAAAPQQSADMAELTYRVLVLGLRPGDKDPSASG
ncbi:hypothetical protein COCSUDRAFT_60471 [Coccomyxa subellipsoidea C-169]|uniref:Uncharacterized protein n=1 Tax=Coccomyxa subellipsoidea (strain C-169) TaxID=574566 RepID=I0YIR0_COCSC|nr:hypothetical protein COCSUDRAFT_60471 [Coccomyxa subellipsoidea C-169]EIE18279.1 hypothetical protein COCSUDRAFT_60471 [Coccomyxa subellipsoidea C-169]|eukprot:XP_005642823.1 hypothetical protein COCSUDRAFT_60471 [Coccomyxa subellipsoidea C-169]